MHTQTLKDYIREAFNNTFRAEACEAIIDYLILCKCNNVDMLTFSLLSSICGQSTITKDIVEAVTLLSGDKLRVLETGFILVDEEGDEFEISKSEMNEAFSTGYLIHPETGQQIPSFLNYIVIFFYPAKEFIEDNCK